MHHDQYARELNIQLSNLYAFARQINELDFAASLSGEFRGMQDAGWSTTITAHEAFEEILALTQRQNPHSKAEYRQILMLYCQLAEAGGVYETIKNIMGVISLKPYLLWPFKDLVRVRNVPARVIGPNANATFRDLATTAKDIGLARLSALLEITFRDDLRNAISHADYVIWSDGVRLRNRNGGNARLLSFEEVSSALNQAINFFSFLTEYNSASIRSFDPPREIVGRLSANPPMPWTVAFDSQTGSFGISGSSPAPVMTPALQRQLDINGRLGGKVLALFSDKGTLRLDEINAHIAAAGFEASDVAMDQSQLSQLATDIDKLGLWDQHDARKGEALLLSPWGFRWLQTPSDFDSVLPSTLLKLDDSEVGPKQTEESAHLPTS